MSGEGSGASRSKGLTTLPRPLLTDPRRVSLDLHAHLRRLIIEGVLPAGEVVNQAELSRTFDVSRTPMREAFRMLQEEGLIEGETNQRARVREFDPNELDQLYGVRIALESLGARITAGRMSAEEAQGAQSALGAMRRAKESEDMNSWLNSHRDFHRLCVVRADEPLLRLLTSYSERSERYLRMYQMWHPHEFDQRDSEHASILEAVIAGDRDAAGARMAQHLAHTSLGILYEVSRTAVGHAIREALSMATARQSSRWELSGSRDDAPRR